MQEDIRFAGLRPRFLALLIDFLLFCAVFFPVTRMVKGGGKPGLMRGLLRRKAGQTPISVSPK